MNTAADEKILDLFFARSEDAITTLDREYGNNCRRISSRILSDLRDSEECVNDAYLGVWNAVPPSRPNPLAAFVYKIVRNISLKRYRDINAEKRSPSCTILLDEIIADVSGNGDPVADEAEMRELSRVLNAFIETLSRENRVIFLRRYWFLDSYAEISKLTGLREKTVSVRLVRVRKELKKYLTERGML